VHKTTSLVAAFLTFKEDACSTTLTEEEAYHPRPALVKISILELGPGNAELISDAARFYQAQANLIPSAAHAATEARDQRGGQNFLDHQLLA
jgi:hypothetical protein